MKKNLLFYILPLAMSIVLWGCSSSVNTMNMSAEEYLNYAMSLYNDGDYIQAINEFQTIVMQYPGNAVTDDAQFYLAESHFQKKEYILAAYEYSRLIRDIPASEFVSKSQFKLAESYYRLSPEYQLDQKYTNKAVEEFQAFIDFFPADEKVPEAESKIRELNNKLAEKEFNTARIYEKMEYFDAAIYYYSVVTDTYHDSKYAREASLRKIRLLSDQKETGKALHEISTFLNKYPDDPDSREVKKLQSELTGKS